MNSKSILIAALVAGLLPGSAFAQAAPAAAQPPSAPQPAAPAAQAVPTPPAPAPPQAYPAKIALVAFEQAVISTNEGQRAMLDVQKKYQPKQAALESLSTEIETLKKQLQSSSATLTDAERATRTKAIDAKQKQLDSEADDAKTAYQSELQDAYAKLAEKVNAVLITYVQTNGYTLLLDVGSQTSPVMWAAPQPNADITAAVIAAYNVSSGIAPPPPEAPEAPAASKPKPAASTAPKPAASTAPKPATSTKPPAQ